MPVQPQQFEPQVTQLQLEGQLAPTQGVLSLQPPPIFGPQFDEVLQKKQSGELWLYAWRVDCGAAKGARVSSTSAKIQETRDA